MAGGTWSSENKVRPGAYINVVNQAAVVSGPSSRGVVAMPLALDFGPAQQFVAISGETECRKLLGYELSEPVLLPVREALKRAETVKVYRLNGGENAAAAGITIGNLTVNARYKGVRGNAIAVGVANDPDNADGFIVSVYLDGAQVDRQQVKTAEELLGNSFVVFSGSGALTVQAATSLSGGVSGSVTAAEYSKFFTAAGVEDFDTVAVSSADSTIKALAVSFVRRMREDEGRRIQAVLADYPNADYEGIISVKNGVVLTDGTVIDKYQAVAWVAGATAGAAVNESNTYTVYDGSADADTHYLHSEIVQALKEGSWVFVPGANGAVVEQDINTLTGFTVEKGKSFAKNRVLRVLDSLVNDVQEIFNKFYLGKVNNDRDGRSLFKAALLNYLEELAAISAIKNLDKENDVQLAEGDSADSVAVSVAVQPVDSVEKLYLTVKVS